MREVLSNALSLINNKEVMFHDYTKEDIEKLTDMVKVAQLDIEDKMDKLEEEQNDLDGERNREFWTICEDVEKFRKNLDLKLIGLEIEDKERDEIDTVLMDLESISKKMNKHYRKY
jgi:hypothetical protein